MASIVLPMRWPMSEADRFLAAPGEFFFAVPFAAVADPRRVGANLRIRGIDDRRELLAVGVPCARVFEDARRFICNGDAELARNDVQYRIDAQADAAPGGQRAAIDDTCRLGLDGRIALPHQLEWRRFGG